MATIGDCIQKMIDAEMKNPSTYHAYWIQKYTDALASFNKDGRMPPGMCTDFGCKRCQCGTCGCFAGFDKVAMADGYVKAVCDIVKGDIVEGGAAVATKVVIKSDCPITMVMLPHDGPTLTDYHPVFVDNGWVFPIDVVGGTTELAHEVYNFVLTTDHILKVNGHDCITLGHGITDDPVLAHPYYGTQKVIDDLKTRADYESGMVVYNNPTILRDSYGFVCGMC